LKILLTADPFLPVPPKFYGGIERIVALLISELRLRGHTVGLVALAGSGAPVDYFRPWPRQPAGGKFAHLCNAFALRAACNDFKPSVLHSFSRLLYLAPLLLRNPVKVMSYQRPAGGWQIRLCAAACGRSLAFTGCSDFIARMGGNHGGRWQAIHNFVDTKSYRFSPSVPADAPLVFLSRIESIKGTHLAIEIAKRAGRRLLIAGNHADSGAEGEYWATRIKPELGRNGIDYVGPLDDPSKIEFLGSAAAMVVPIQWDEPFGIVFAEALACGTPVITCPRGAATEIIRDSVEGFFIRDAEQGCRAVAQIAAIDRNQCRARAEQAFSVSAIVPQYEALYKALLDGSTPRAMRT
jgi:glycosyltransferase involved in cell wall biosynthesis